jgi:hypothetical protein
MQIGVEILKPYSAILKPVGDVDIEPLLSESQALQYALKHIGAEVYKWQIPEEEQGIFQRHILSGWIAGYCERLVGDQ